MSIKNQLTDWGKLKLPPKYIRAVTTASMIPPDYGRWRVVVVRFPGYPKFYSYFAPFSWGIRAGDKLTVVVANLEKTVIVVVAQANEVKLRRIEELPLKTIYSGHHGVTTAQYIQQAAGLTGSNRPVGVLIDAIPFDSQATTNQEQDMVSIRSTNLKIVNQVMVTNTKWGSVKAEDLGPDQLLEVIVEAKAEIKALKDAEIESTYVTKRIEALEQGIKDVTALLDAR